MRKTLFKVHSYLALLALVPLILVSLTGSILVFKTELDQLLMPGVASLTYEGAPERTELNASVRHIEKQLPNYVIGTWELFDDGREADRVYLIQKGTEDWYKIHFDPFANTILDTPQPLNSQFTDWLVLLHYTFLLNDLGGETGTLVGLIAALLLITLGITGLIIHRKFWRQLFTLRRGKSARVFNGDLHRLVGAWSSPLILVLGITGGYFNAVEAYHELVEHAHEEPMPLSDKLYGAGLNFEEMYQRSQRELSGFKPTYLRFPYEPEHEFTIFGAQPDLNILASDYASSVTFDRETGVFLAAYQGPEAPAITRVTDSFRELHFGSFGGVLVKMLWSLLGFAPCVLALTGMYLWLKRTFRRPASGQQTVPANSLG